MATPTRSLRRVSSFSPRSHDTKAAAPISGATIPMPEPRNAPSSLGAQPVLPPLPDVMLEPIVRLALQEDLGAAGDVTTDALIDPTTRGRWTLKARNGGVVAGLDAALLAARLVDVATFIKVEKCDGESVVA